MNYRMICRVLGAVLLCVAAVMLIPLIVAIRYHESLMPFAVTIASTALIGICMYKVKLKSRDIFAREGFIVVSLAWIVMSLLGAIPFVLSGDIPSYIDAVFETVSGFTTTGASVVTNVESMSRSCLFWRLFTHWLGGMGVLVFIMAVLPMDSSHSMHIMRAEVPGPTVGKLVPRIRQTAKILYLIYAAFTLIEMVLLLLGGMSFYDALLNSFATAGTGGFSTRAASIAAYDSVYIEMVLAVFMLLFGINFNLYFLIIIGKVKEALKSKELHVYLLVIASATLGIALGISKMYDGLATALRHAFFNVSSIITTTGFGTEDFTKWPSYCQWILVMLMFSGACAGSTGGGIKIARVIILVKSSIANTRAMAHPRRVQRVRLEGKSLDAVTASSVYGFFIMYIFLLICVTFVVSFDGYDLATNFTAALSCLSNIGPGMSLVGPCGSFSIFSPLSKLVLAFAMLLGRLEIFPLAVLFLQDLRK